MRKLSAEKQEELDIARQMKLGWLKCEMALMTSQEYRMGTKILRRVDLKEVREQVKYWTAEVQRLEGTGGIRVRQIIARDT